MLIIQYPNPLVMHLDIVWYRQDIWYQLPPQGHAAADIPVFPQVAPYSGPRPAVFKKRRINHSIELFVCHNAVMDDDVTFLFTEYRKHALYFTGHPDVILVGKKNIGAARMCDSIGDILLDPFALPKDQVNPVIALCIGAYDANRLVQ